MLAVEDLWSDGFFLRTPFAALAGRGLAAAEPTAATRPRSPYRARSYWRFAEPETFYAAA